MTLTNWADNWASPGHDNFQSRVSHSSLNLSKTGLLWKKDSGFYPQPAWGGAAIQDFYDNRGVILKDMRDYDLADGIIYFSGKLVQTSIASSTVFCYDAKTGKELWHYTAGAAIRVAASYHEDKIYFGSDDGFMYCLDAESGKKLWQYRPSLRTSTREVLHNGKLISTHPCRTGVIIEGDVAYCGFSLLPWQQTYLSAVDINSGKEIYCKTHSNLTMEGPIAFIDGRIIASMGRLSPKIFNARKGNILATLPNGGGTFLLITPTQEILHAPGGSKGWVDAVSLIVPKNDKKKGSILKLNSLKAIVNQNKIYSVGDKDVSCVDRSQNNKTLWKVDNSCHYAAIIVQDKLVLGGDNLIRVISCKDGKELGRVAVSGKVHQLIAGDKKLFATTNQGITYAFGPSKKTAFTTKKNIKERPEIKAGSAVLSVPPIVVFKDKNEATITWETEKPCSSVLNYGLGTRVDRSIKLSRSTKKHRITIKNLDHYQKYSYNISVGSKQTPTYELNTFFNFSKSSFTKNRYPVSKKTKLYKIAKFIKQDSGLNRGVALVVGVDSGELIYNLAQMTQLHIIAVDTDEQRVNRCRENLLRNKSYGDRISVNYVADLKKLDWPENFANIICSERLFTDKENSLDEEFVASYLNAYNSYAYVSPKFNSKLYDFEKYKLSTLSMIKIGNPIPVDHGEWTTLYGNNNNSAFGGESLGNARATSDLQLQWIGRPGPLHQADRSGRKTAPLASNGRLYIEGINRLIAMNAANGTVLWNIEMPGLTRMNTPRDCSNYVCDEQNVFVVVDNNCYKFSGQTGKLLNTFEVVTTNSMNPEKNWTYDWSYIASHNKLLIGSAVKAKSEYTNFKGGKNSGWYDAVKHADVNSNVCSENLFAIDKNNGQIKWRYITPKGIIINPTIGIDDDTVVFVESREFDRKSADKRRLDSLDKDLFLIALDANTGKKKWQTPLTITEGTSMISLAISRGVIVVNSSHAGNYHIYGFNLQTGKDIWATKIPWVSNHHGGHLARPAIVDNKIYNNPGILDLYTGKQYRIQKQIRGKCGTYSCTTQGLFFRSGSITFYNFFENKRAGAWNRLRSDCWLSMIPACGLLLAPEGGGGCDCDAGWFEISVAFTPKKRPALSFEFSNRTFYGKHQVRLLNRENSSYAIRYTLDDSAPTATSSVYKKPLLLEKSTTVKTGLFDKNKLIGEIITQRFEQKK